MPLVLLAAGVHGTRVTGGTRTLFVSLTNKITSTWRSLDICPRHVTEQRKGEVRDSDVMCAAYHFVPLPEKCRIRPSFLAKLHDSG